MMAHNHILTLAICALSVTTALAKPYYFLQEIKNDEPLKPAEVASNPEQIVGPTEQLPQRIHGHLNELYTHGSSAVKSVVDTVQPDLSNIGKDLTDVYHVTRDNVGKRIEPLAQTVRPYIDHAQKVISPYMSQAKEEVPKLIQQAGPALSKVGEQVRDGITGVWGKLTNGGHPNGPETPGQAQLNGEQLQRAVTNSIQQPADGATQVAQQAANPSSR